MVLTATSGTMHIIVAVENVYFLSQRREKKQEPFSTAILNKEHLRMGTARRNTGEGKKRGVNMGKK